MNGKIIFILLCFISIAPAQFAFPGAEGYGRYSIGGRGGKAIYVTSLADSGTGTLREAINAKGPRTIMFSVSGVIHSKRLLVIKNPYITIAGQTSPANGITIIGSGIYITTNDVIIRHLRIRPGDTATGVACDGRDAIGVGENSNNIMIDHVSLSWAVDENFSTWYNVKNLTLQNSIISEALYQSCHSKGAHSKGILIGDTSKYVSIHNNFIAHNDDRNPTIKPYSKSDFVNNIVYNWGKIGYHFNCDACLFNTDTAKSNNIHNFYKRGPSTMSSFLSLGSSKSMPLFKLHINKNDGNDSLLADYNSNAQSYLNKFSFLSASPVDYGDNIKFIDPVRLGLFKILLNSGANKPKLDHIDSRVINEFIIGAGRIINSQNEVGGYPLFEKIELSINDIKNIDSDMDGLPNEYELKMKLDPNDSLDASKITDGGYSNLEMYINSL